MLLAFDTSTSVASIALVTPPSAENGDEARLVAELTWRVGQRHSTELLERLEWLLASAHVTMGDLTGIAVALGPGSFNGVRVALATAKSLAFARTIPLSGTPTLDVIAWGHRAAHGASLGASAGTVCAILEAGRGQVYAATYEATTDAATWAPLDGYQVTTAAELAGRLTGAVYFCGEMTPATRATLAEALGGRFRGASPVEERRASWLAELALARAAHQRYDDAMALEPLYLRRPAITTSARHRLSAPEDADGTRQRKDAPKGEGSSDALRR
jgi:tRNA threonylcarbamoyladenosine biosynthesis protein TsaB